MTKERIPHFLSASAVKGLAEAHISHPLNENSNIYLKRLSPELGLSRLALYVARVPPGKESFAYHSHERNEEFIFVLSGRGIAQIGEDEIEIGRGDFMAFPAPDGPAHHLVNPYEEDLVYLMGGECSALDVAHFPRLGKRLVFSGSGILSVQDDQCEHLNLAQWIAD